MRLSRSHDTDLLQALLPWMAAVVFGFIVFAIPSPNKRVQQGHKVDDSGVHSEQQKPKPKPKPVRPRPKLIRDLFSW